MDIGQQHGLQPYGVEALSVLRIEKGHVTHNEINGTVVPATWGLRRMVSMIRTDFIGRSMVGRARALCRPRGQRSSASAIHLDPRDTFRSGSHILGKDAAATLENDQGYVTSSAFSPHLGSTIGWLR